MQRLTYDDEKDHRKSGNCLIQKCHRCTRCTISKYFLSSVYKSLFISLSGQTRVDVTVSLRMTGARASRVLYSRSKQIPLMFKGRQEVITKIFSHTLHLGKFRKFLAKSGRWYKNSRCRVRGYHTCRNRRTWSKGTGGWGPSREGTRGFCLPRKDF